MLVKQDFFRTLLPFPLSRSFANGYTSNLFSLTQGYITRAIISPIPGKTEVSLPYASSLRA